MRDDVAAQAQATRTWVSGLGDDANPCSRTAPCKTFPGAYSRTAVGGEIDVIDPGGFGAISIGHSITIDGGGGVMASILNTSGGNAVNINAGASDDIILRNLTLTGVKDYAFPGGTGVQFNSGRQLSIEHCVIENWHIRRQHDDDGRHEDDHLEQRDQLCRHRRRAAAVDQRRQRGEHLELEVVNSGAGVQAHANVSIQVSYSMISNNVTGDGLLVRRRAFRRFKPRTRRSTANNVGAHAITGGTVRIGHDAITVQQHGRYCPTVSAR